MREAVDGSAPFPKHRDRAGEERDRDAEERDRAAEERDLAAEERDQDADARDREAEQSEASVDGQIGAAARARREAASDRRAASQDRRAGTGERSRADVDRRAALADREESAQEREDTYTDDRTDVHHRRSGLVQLDQEIDTARRRRQSLVLATVGVNGCESVDESLGHAAGDRMLRDVAKELRTQLHPHAVIIRYGIDAFVCAISGLDMAVAAHQLAIVEVALAEGPDQASITVGLAELLPDDTPAELVSRAHSAVQRDGKPDSGHTMADVLTCGDIVVNDGARSVSRCGSTVTLTATEFSVLGVLVRKPALVVSKGELLTKVWKPNAEVDDHLVEVHICSLRRKLEVYGPRMIHTVRGWGYILRPQCDAASR